MFKFCDYLKIENNCVINTQKLEIENKSVPFLILEKLIKFGNKEILIDCEVDKRWTANEVYIASTKLATKLIEIGVKKGDFVATHCPNRDYKVIAYLAVTSIGAVYTGCIQKAPFGEINNLIKSINVSYVISCEDNLNQCDDLLEQNGSLKAIFILDSEEDVGNYKSIPKLIKETDFKNCCNLLEIASAVTGDDLLQVVLISGSIDTPKALKLTHKQISSDFFVTLSDYNFVTANDTIAVYSDFCYPLALHQIVCALYSGAKACVFAYDSKEKVYSMCEKYDVTVFYAIPYLLSEFNKLYTNKSSIKLEKVICGSDNLPVPIAEEFVQKFKPSFFTQHYGKLETGFITFHPFSASTHYFKSVGIPVVGVVCKVVDLETGEDLGFNQIGEIRVKLPHVFNGYLDNRVNISAMFDENGFYKTDDAGYFDEKGCFYFVNRLTSIIKVAGWCVNPLELESIILQNENVEKAVVVGVEEGIRGKLLKAFVVIKTDRKGEISEQQLLDFVNSQVCDYKQLTAGLTFVDSLPNN